MVYDIPPASVGLPSYHFGRMSFHLSRIAVPILCMKDEMGTQQSDIFEWDAVNVPGCHAAMQLQQILERSADFSIPWSSPPAGFIKMLFGSYSESSTLISPELKASAKAAFISSGRMTGLKFNGGFIRSPLFV